MTSNTIRAVVKVPPKRNAPWNRIKGRLSSPSHRWPRIQVCAGPSRQTGNFLRAPSSPANAMNAEPMMPKAIPTTLPPLLPCGGRIGYQQ